MQLSASDVLAGSSCIPPLKNLSPTILFVRLCFLLHIPLHNWCQRQRDVAVGTVLFSVVALVLTGVLQSINPVTNY